MRWEVSGLRPVEAGKHRVLLTAVMRLADRLGVPGYERALAIPYRLLAAMEAAAPGVIASVLEMPQFGAWGDDCIRRLRAEEGAAAEPGAPLETDLGHLALFAVTAALRAGVPFRLEIPLRTGTACLPGLGVVTVGASAPWDWGLAWRDAGDRRCGIRSSAGSVVLPRNLSTPDCPGWRPFLTLTADGEEDGDGGPCFAVVVDDADPFLDRYGVPRASVADTGRAAWRVLLCDAWRILARDHPDLASTVAGVVRAVVPLASPGPTRTQESTEAASFGAIATSLPADALSMAEVLVHEAHHGILGVLLDTGSLVDEAAARGFLGYGPWRDDPRPASALLQGIIAHYGMGLFWRRQYGAGSAGQRRRAAARFAGLRAMTARTITLLQDSAGPGGGSLLTADGRDLLADLGQEVTGWLAESLPAEALRHAADLAVDHEVRWRIAHLVPDPALTARLAEAWRRGSPLPLPVSAVPARIEPGPLSTSAANLRAFLLDQEYERPGGAHEYLTVGELPADPADSALADGRDVDAAAGYLRRIAASADDADAWAGLATARRRTGPPAVAAAYAARPELVRALHALARTGLDDDHLPDRLAAWLAA